ncbi:MAG TPA: hypothetical protein VGO59_03335 [Verrucomicrobiae bacterium]
MVCRCSSLVAVLALLTGGICTLPSTAVRAGDRIEFSSPAIPLAIPQPEVETKQPPKLYNSTLSSDGVVNGGGYLPPAQVTFMTTRKMEKDPWNKNPWDKDRWNTDPFKDRDEIFNGVLDQTQSENQATNTLAAFGLQREKEAHSDDAILLHRDGSLDGQNGQDGQDDSRFDHGNKSNQSERGLFGKDSSDQKDDSSFFRSFIRPPSGSSRFNAGAFVAYDHDATSLTGRAADWQFNQAPGEGEDPTRLSFANAFTPQHPEDNRRDAATAASSYVHAWDDAAAPQPSAAASAARSRLFSDQNNPSRVVAPNRPAILPWAKRPGDPNPF